MAIEAAVDPFTWVPVAGSVGSGLFRALSAGARRMFMLDLGEAAARGITQGVAEEIANDGADMAVAIARRRLEQGVRRAAASDARSSIAGLQDDVAKQTEKITADYAERIGDERGLIPHIWEHFDGEMADAMRTYRESVRTIDGVFGEGFVDEVVVGATGTLGKAPPTVKAINQTKEAALAASRSRMATLAAERDALLNVVKKQGNEMVRYAGTRDEQALRKAVQKAVKDALSEFDHNAPAMLKKAREEGLEFIQRQLDNADKLPSGDIAAEIAKATADDIATIAGLGGGKATRVVKQLGEEGEEFIVKNVKTGETIGKPHASRAAAELAAGRAETKLGIESAASFGKGAAPKGAPVVEAIDKSSPGALLRTSIGRLLTKGKVVGDAQGGMPLGFHLVRLMNKASFGQAQKFMRALPNVASFRYLPKEVRKFIREQMPRTFIKAKERAEQLMFFAENRQYVMARHINRAAREANMDLVEYGKLLNNAVKNGEMHLIADDVLRSHVEQTMKILNKYGLDLAKEADLPPEMIEKIVDNFGQYLHLSYAKHNVKGWAKRVQGSAVWEDAHKWFVKNTNLSDDEIQGTMLWLVRNGRPPTLGGALRSLQTVETVGQVGRFGEALPKGAMDVLKRKKEIPRVIQKLMGLEEDFLTNHQVTSAKLIYDLEMSVANRRVLEQGLRHGVFTLNPTKANHAEVRFGNVFNKPVYTTPELSYVFEAVEEYGKNGFWNLLLGASGVVKFGKVGMSHPTLMRNLYSIGFMLTSNGTMMRVMRNPSIVAPVSGWSRRSSRAQPDRFPTRQWAKLQSGWTRV
jgi:hypothetical protein